MAQPRAPWSIFWVGRDSLARIDVDPRHAERRHKRVVPNGSDELATALETLLAGEPAPGERALVLFEGVWTQTLELGAPIVAGLGAAELAQALAFELEPASGLSAVETPTSHVTLDGAPPGRQRFWAVQIAQRELDAARATLAARQSRLVAMAHPAGIVLPARGPRVEVWAHATWCGGAGAPAVVIGSQPGSRSWEQALREWCGVLGPLEVEVCSPSRTHRQMARAIVPRSIERAELLEPDAWPELLAAAATRLIDERSAPLLRTEVRRRAWIGPVLVGAVLTLIVGALCARDAVQIGIEAYRSGEHAQDLARSGEIVAALRKRDAELTKELAQREPPLVERERRLQRAVAARSEPGSRLHEMLVQLGAQRMLQIALVRIEPTPGGGQRIEGVSSSQDEVGALAAALAHGTAGLWTCSPVASSRIADRAAWHFQLDLAVPESAERSTSR